MLIIFAFWAQRFRLNTDSNPAPVSCLHAPYPGCSPSREQRHCSPGHERSLLRLVPLEGDAFELDNVSTTRTSAAHPCVIGSALKFWDIKRLARVSFSMEVPVICKHRVPLFWVFAVEILRIRIEAYRRRRCQSALSVEGISRMTHP